LEKEAGLEMLNRLFDTKGYDKINPLVGGLVKKFMEIYRPRNENRCIRVVYEQCMQDYLRYYRMETPAPIYFNYKQLGANNISTFMKESEGLKSLNYFIEENFLKDRGKKFLYYSLLMYVKGRFAMEDEYLVNLLYSIFKYHGINVG
jgi:hypothetical protein